MSKRAYMNMLIHSVKRGLISQRKAKNYGWCIVKINTFTKIMGIVDPSYNWICRDAIDY